MIYIVWSVFFCFCLLYVAQSFVVPRVFRAKKTKHEDVVKKVDVGYIEKLLQNGEVMPYCSHKDVELLRRHGLFICLPLIKLNSPSMEELRECERLQKKYEFATYVVDCEFDKKNISGNFVFLSTSETSSQILFALNRLKLVAKNSKCGAPLAKTNYKKTVNLGLKYEFDIKEKLTEETYSIIEYLPPQKDCYFVAHMDGQTIFENLYDGNCFYVWSNKKIEIKYEKIMQKLIFNISKNQLNNNLIIFLSNKKIDKLNYNPDFSSVSWSTTNEALNKKIKLAFESCEEAYYKKFGFALTPTTQKNFDKIEEFIFFVRGGEIEAEQARQIFLEQFLGVKISGDRVSFSKPKLCEDYVLSVEHDGKKYLITRKQTNSNICEICIDGVSYRNFTSFCFHGIEKPEIFVEY